MAVAVLAGALLVGDSVKASLRGLVFQRLGNTQQVLAGQAFFRESLAEELGAGAPLIALQGIVAGENQERRAAGVSVYGVDERFWRLHGLDPRDLGARDALASPALALELGVKEGDALQLIVERPSEIPLESLHGHKDDRSRAIRLTFRSALAPGQLGEFSLRPQQGAVRALFVPLNRLQRDLDRTGKANLALFSRPVSAEALRSKARLEDLGIRLRPLGEQRGTAVESETMILSEDHAQAVERAAREAGAKAEAIYTYLANTIRVDGREIPYSLVTAAGAAGVSAGGIALNEWAARELRAALDDEIYIEYFLWNPEGRLLTESATFKLERILPMAGFGADRELAPEYPGIADSDSLSDWDPPFPFDLSRVRPADEAYWDRYRTSPKAFIALERGQELWASRFGKLTSIRVHGGDQRVFSEKLLQAMDPARAGVALTSPLEAGLEASTGATDFGEYFTYFSFFLVVAALLLAGLFFRFGIEQRVREIGALRAVGFSRADVRRLLFLEGSMVAVAGAAAGVLGAAGYAALIVYGLRTWWVDAVGTTLLTLHLSAAPLAMGALGGAVSAAAFLLLSLRQLRRATPRGLLAGTAANVERKPRAGRAAFYPAYASVFGSALLIVGGALGVIGQAAAFFGASALLLTGSLCFQWLWLVRRPDGGMNSIFGLGLRYTSYRPGRSILCVALIASAAFIIVAVDSFRRGDAPATERRSGTGGFPLMAHSVLPLYHDINTPPGRENLNLPEELGEARIFSFRLRSGDDASCLNLYRPRNPRIIAPSRGFIQEARFLFAASLAETREERANPWVLLESQTGDGSIPAIADANSLKYVLRKKLGDVIEIPGGVRLKFVAALADSVLQSEIAISSENFVRAFPREEGFRLFLIETPTQRTAGTLEQALADFGFDVTSTRDRLAAFHRVENTYLSTFQALGGLGLLLGTAGLGAVLLRNVLERRREIALLRAIGYTPGNLRLVLLSENLVLLGAGLATGCLCALVAIAPAWWERGGGFPIGSMAVLLAVVLLTGLIASAAALRLAGRSSILSGLRSE